MLPFPGLRGVVLGEPPPEPFWVKAERHSPGDSQGNHSLGMDDRTHPPRTGWTASQPAVLSVFLVTTAIREGGWSVSPGLCQRFQPDHHFHKVSQKGAKCGCHWPFLVRTGLVLLAGVEGGALGFF